VCLTHVDHGLYGEDLSLLHHPHGLVMAVVRYAGSYMEHVAYTMATVGLHYLEAAGQQMQVELHKKQHSIAANHDSNPQQ
jgi:hypothetical protein